jgi:imidazolonepropionase
MAEFQALVHASEVWTGIGIRHKDGRKPVEADLGLIPDGALVYNTRKIGTKTLPDQIVWVGATKDLPEEYAQTPKRDLGGKHVVVPGLIDCHTHLVFAGDRSEEFALRCGGATYEEIASKGGGIQTTVNATRDASVEELEALAIPRVQEAWGYGVRTLEIKSGYGLKHDAELRSLQVVENLRARFPEMTFVSTYLGAHAWPKDQTKETYLAEMMAQTLPEVAKKKLASFCDVFIDEGYFSREEGRLLLERARELGLNLKVHADELGNTESASLAAHVAAHSADHLLKISDDGIKELAKSETVAVLLPGTAFYLKAEHAPARKLIDAGACVALSTDFNPGTCMTLNLPAILTIAALYLKMTRAEIFAAVTYNAARAIGLENRKGTIEAGRDADVTVLPFARFEECYYRFAWSG